MAAIHDSSSVRLMTYLLIAKHLVRDVLLTYTGEPSLKLESTYLAAAPATMELYRVEYLPFADAAAQVLEYL
jgi:hypothetical protein